MSKEVLGILGVGHLASYVVAGLRRAKDKRKIILSPRNNEYSQNLKSAYNCDIATSNQDVINKSDIVLIAVRPEHLERLISEVNFTSKHLVISCVTGVSLEKLHSLIPNATIVKTLPLASVEIGEGVVPLFPKNSIAQNLLEPIGKLITFENEDDYELASTAAVLNGVVFGFMDELSQWFENKGLSSNQARDIVIHTLRSATGLADFKQNQTLKQINDSIATSGTYTKKAQELIIEKNGFKSWTDTCEIIHKELRK